MIQIRIMSMLLIIGLTACSSNYEVSVTKPVDLKRYSGTWYEIASFPTTFHKECFCTTANYALTQDYLLVKNTCYTRVNNRTLRRSLTGKAYPTPNTQNSHLSIEFYWPLKADYWIVYLDNNYQYAAVSVPSKKYLWIISRTPTLDPQIYKELLLRLKNAGFDISQLKIAKACTKNIPLSQGK